MGLFPKHVLEYIALAGIPRGPQSKIFVVDPAHGATGNTGESWGSPLTTVSAALAKCTTGHHDVVLVVASGTAITETAAVDWNLNLTHLIGIGTDTPHGKRTRIISGTDDLSPFITVSGYGCTFKNLRIVHEQADDTGSLICVKVTGERNRFESVEFCGNATESSALDTGCSLYLQGASECLFKDCVIGLDTIAEATGCMALVIHGSGGMNRTRFESCIFNAYANSTSVGFVESLGATGIDRMLVFKDCEFWNMGPQTIATAFVFGAVDYNYKRIALINCFKLGATDWDHANTGMVYVYIPSSGTTNAAGTAVITSS